MLTVSVYLSISFTGTFKAVAAFNTLAPSKCTFTLALLAILYT